MFKRRCSLYLALISGGLTLLIGLAQDVRLMTIGYRCMVSIIIFGICGYLCAIAAESLLPGLPAETNTKGQMVDIVAKNENDLILPPQQPPASGDNFNPLTAENFDHISVESDGSSEAT